MSFTVFALDEHGYAKVVDETVDGAIAVYLQTEIAPTVDDEIEKIKKVISSGTTWSGSGNALFVTIGPEISVLKFMVGTRNKNLEIKTTDLLNYVTLWRNFLVGEGR